ncbi:hypothetical protein [Clostridium folliculivorans]|uniref:Uncharacterized protein n=1 Tax=Clostridium folliculivorans TaxID=2886038 RepID=A0A9W5Y1N3_9CLOT|nr:hypothetical protein [Clostridium folliculivorans]GKU24904.1 hypothetical protein CFOLD11_17300 [Clostridium folliculivorans]GKU31002.1 hypothetical protein CFB3_31090 [Clostridium folliculivorans]
MYINIDNKEIDQSFQEKLIGVGHVDSKGRIKSKQKIYCNTIEHNFILTESNFKTNKINLFKIPRWLTIPVSIILYLYLFLDHNKIFGTLNLLAGFYLMYYFSEKSIRFKKRNFFIKFIIMALITIYMLFFGAGAILSDSLGSTDIKNTNRNPSIEASFNYFYLFA